MKLEEYDQTSRMSSCVDDVFYILRGSIARATSTGDPDCVCAVINGIGRILEVDYISEFQKRLATAFSTTDARESKLNFVVRGNLLTSRLPFAILKSTLPESPE